MHIGVYHKDQVRKRIWTIEVKKKKMKKWIYSIIKMALFALEDGGLYYIIHVAALISLHL